MMAHKWRLYRKTLEIILIIFVCKHNIHVQLHINIGGALHHGFTAGILTFALVSGVSFVKCAHDVNERYEMMRKVYSAQNIKNNSKRIPESQPPPIL